MIWRSVELRHEDANARTGRIEDPLSTFLSNHRELCTKRHRGFLPREAGEGDHATHVEGGEHHLPPPARFARHLPREAGRNRFIGPGMMILCKAPPGERV